MTPLDTRYTLGSRELTVEESRVLLAVVTVLREQRLKEFLKIEISRQGAHEPRVRFTTDAL